MAKKIKKKTRTSKPKTLAKAKKGEKSESWISFQVIGMLAIIFIITQCTGLFVAQALFNQGIQQAPITGNVNDVENGLYLFGIIIIMTIILLIVIKFRRTTKFLWAIEALALFTTSIIVFSAFLPFADLLVILLTALLLYVRYWKRKNILIKDIAGMIAIIGAGGYIGLSIGLLPLLAFVIILAIYDIIAVFYTKHMLTIGKAATKQNLIFTITMPTKKHTFELGNGDLIIPLVVAASVLINGPYLNNALIAGLCLIASFAGLLISLYTVSKWKRAMPALPPQTALMLIILITAILLGV